MLSQPQGQVLGYIIACLERIFVDGGGKNYVEMEFARSTKDGGGAYLVTLQEANHPSPHKLREYAEQRYAMALANYESIASIVHEIESDFIEQYLKQARLSDAMLRGIQAMQIAIDALEGNPTSAGQYARSILEEFVEKEKS